MSKNLSSAAVVIDAFGVKSEIKVDAYYIHKMYVFQKGIGLKSSTSPVRNAYIQCMSASFHGKLWE